MWEHSYAPVGESLGLSAIVAAIPILVLFVMLGALRKPAWMAAVSALLSALLVSLTVYGMPARLALISTVYGAAYGLFPIAWIVFSSIMLYRLAVDTGKFEIIKDSVGGLTDDRRLQAMFIAFCLWCVHRRARLDSARRSPCRARCWLDSASLRSMRPESVCWPTLRRWRSDRSAFLSSTLANVTGLPMAALSAMVGRLCAMISVIIPGYLIVVMRGPKRALEVLPAIIACGLSFAGVQFYVSNYIGPELTDILSSLTCIVVMVRSHEALDAKEHPPARGRHSRPRRR